MSHRIALVISLVAMSCAGAFANPDSQATITRLSELIRKEPSNISLRKEIASAYLRAGLAVRAEEQMKIVLTYGTRSTDDYTLLGDIQRYSGKYSDAFRSYLETLSREQTNAAALSGIAYCQLLTGNAAAADKICRDGLKQVSAQDGRKQLIDTLHAVEQSRRQEAAERIAITAIDN